MATQLVLLESGTPSWKLDARTREIGRRGLAEARDALRRASGPTGAGSDAARRSRAA
jgi:hypothetical protein